MREYLAYAIPVIIGCRDTDFPQIERFVSKWKGRRVPRSRIAHLNIVEEEKRRLQFFEDVLAGKTANLTTYHSG